MIQAGLNSEVEHRGKVFHVQTESIERSAPVVETLVYSGGQILVRMTASLADIAERANLPYDDVQHALKLQHWGLVRKIQHGMLRDDDDPPDEPLTRWRPEPTTKVTPADLAACTEPSVRELLDELQRRIGEAHRTAPAKRTASTANPARTEPRHWWERYTGRVSVVVRW